MALPPVLVRLPYRSLYLLPNEGTVQMPNSDSKVWSLQVGLYLIAAMVLLDQITQLAVTVYPFRISQVQWRIAAFGLAFGFSTSVLVSDLLIFWAAAGLDHRRVGRWWAALHLVFAVVMGALLGNFVLDMVEVRSILPAEAFRPLGVNAVRATLMALLMIGYCLFVFLYARRRFPEAEAREEASATDKLLASKRGS